MPALESSQFSRETNPRASPAPKEGSSQSIAQSAAANTLRGHLSQQGEGKELWGGGSGGQNPEGGLCGQGLCCLRTEVSTLSQERVEVGEGADEVKLKARHL